MIMSIKHLLKKSVGRSEFYRKDSKDCYRYVLLLNSVEQMVLFFFLFFFFSSFFFFFFFVYFLLCILPCTEDFLPIFLYIIFREKTYIMF